jgi:shikimate kinase
MVISLIGYRGSGKSSVAPLLASRLGWEWFDADSLIEKAAGCTIREIFTNHGEPHFRELERQVMAELLGRQQIVIAAGGGAILNADTRRLLSTAGPVVWLRASIATLEGRINQDVTTAARRPALTNRIGAQEIEELLAQREPLYRQCASLTIDTDGQGASRIADQILGSLPRDQSSQ